VGADELKPPPNFGSWEDAEKLRKWSFRQRTPQQRLEWLVQALTIAYQCGALKQPAAKQPAAKQPAAETGVPAKAAP
jgi:hypothetical protein